MMIILRKSDKEISLHHDNLEGNAVAILVLISGSNNSGKSIYAEQLIAKTIGKRYYIATMRPCTEDNHRRIKSTVRRDKDLALTRSSLPIKWEMRRFHRMELFY